MNILGLDPATHCGWAYWSGKEYKFGVWDLSIKKDESKGMRLLRLKRNLMKFEQEVWKPDLVAYETPKGSGPGRQAAMLVQGAIIGVITLWCEEKGIEYKGFQPTEVKLFATGYGQASKEEMMTFAKSRLGADVSSDDEADALWTLALGNSLFH
jgi:Holliday junction resolvasome RuvABC endonuclease subunit